MINCDCQTKNSNCQYSDYAKQALKNNWAITNMCGVLCKGELRVYKLYDGETYWFVAPDKESCIKEYRTWETGWECFSIEPVLFKDNISVYDEETNSNKTLLELLMETNGFAVIASSVY